MASHVYLKIGDIEGESTDSKHAGEIEVLDWQWGMSQSGSIAAGGGAGQAGGGVGFQDLTFTHYFDKATPNLMKLCATGKHVDDATLTILKPGGEKDKCLAITMNKVFVTGVYPSGQGGDGGMTENVTLQFAKVEVEYIPQGDDGSGGGALTFSYDIKEDTEC